LPARDGGEEATRRGEGRRKTVLAVVIGLVVAGVVLFTAIIGFGLLYELSARELDVSEEIEASVLTIHDAAEWFELDIKPGLEVWDTDFYFDRSAQVYYSYNDEEDSIYINCNLTYEPKKSDALMSYGIEWGSLELTNRLGPGEPITLEDQSDLFRWGDASRFAFQHFDGERYGMAFVTRKGGKVFFLDCWGIVLEDEDEIAEFIVPHLEALERAEFRKQKKKKDTANAESEEQLSGVIPDDSPVPDE